MHILYLSIPILHLQPTIVYFIQYPLLLLLLLIDVPHQLSHIDGSGDFSGIILRGLELKAFLKDTKFVLMNVYFYNPPVIHQHGLIIYETEVNMLHSVFQLDVFSFSLPICAVQFMGSFATTHYFQKPIYTIHLVIWLIMWNCILKF
ncbi:hypothetical protein ACJX0J_027800 [Zea mays]